MQNDFLNNIFIIFKSGSPPFYSVSVHFTHDVYNYKESVQSLSHAQLFVIPWTVACQAPLSSTISWSLLKFISIELVMLSNHLILCCPLLLLLSIFPSIRAFSNESSLHICWPNYWSFIFSISPSNEYSGLISFKMTGLILVFKGLSRVFSGTTIRKHQFFSA